MKWRTGRWMLEQETASSAQMMGTERVDRFEVSCLGGAKCFTPSRLGGAGLAMDALREVSRNKQVAAFIAR